MTTAQPPVGDSEDVVYVASQPYRNETEVTLEMRETDGGEHAVMVYSSLPTLVAGAGEQQPWIAVPRERVPELVRRSGADGVLLDTVIPPGLRRGGPEGPQ
ncbi:MAG: hypothetical protein GEV00_21410 [Actinophytocola sp.]|nr:hypothetical protein [Actinophytocola sp.]